MQAMADAASTPPSTVELIAESIREGRARAIAREARHVDNSTQRWTKRDADAAVWARLAVRDAIASSRMLRASAQITDAAYAAGLSVEMRSALTRRLAHLPASSHALATFSGAGTEDAVEDAGDVVRVGGIARRALEDCARLRAHAEAVLAPA